MLRTGMRVRRGSALVPALLVVLLMSGLCLSYIQLSLNKGRESQVNVDAKRAFYVAEAGLAEAFYGLATGKSGVVASEGTPAAFGSGVFWVTAESAGDDRVTLRSTGLAGLGREALSVTLQKAQSSVASLGLFSNQSATLARGSVVDSYDSRVGAYTPPSGSPGLIGLDGGSGASGGAAQVGSNASITLQGGSLLVPGAMVFGNAIPGPGGSVIRGSGATVTGSMAPASQPTELPALSVDVPAGATRLDLLSSRLVTWSGGTHEHSRLHLAPNSKLLVTGPAELVLDELVVDAGAGLSIDASAGPVTIRVASYLALASGSTFTTVSQATSKVSLLVAASQTIDRTGDGVPDAPVNIAANGPFYGSAYVPSASVTIPASFEVFGSFVADRIVLGEGGKLHFDQALLSSLAEGSLPGFVCWRIVELPDSELVKMGYDPVTVMKVNSVTPVKSSEAHYEADAVPVVTVREWVKPVTRVLAP